jgi:YMGG-like Gly-zipper
MFKKFLILPAAALAFACSNGDKTQTAADSALNSDLSTAAASAPTTPLDSISAAERTGVAAAPAKSLTSTASAPRTVTRAPVRRTTTTRRSSSSSSGGTYSSAPVYSAPAPAPVVKHTKRDAAIGAGAGAVIGAVTSRNKVKGAIIGGAAGAILGGVIGNNVDKH